MSIYGWSVGRAVNRVDMPILFTLLLQGVAHCAVLTPEEATMIAESLLAEVADYKRAQMGDGK